MNGDQQLFFAMYKSKQREEAIQAGFYDGRFKTKTQVSKKHKAPKYKHKLTEAC